ncbi:sporulation protein YqfC [Fuchsiella alkaliacetigena]|uniref:sporulation protein YqfC n=1 Tax=Fuchsiella alkaliacetigena TaxID=957042 RepID=UPI00200B7701|nr:sporulation protein YqfC [Fuchsiella alkaliacetigena]MCK8824456.1 sporulation protein YqfC [Fuchsiella alkaliacetigena]
MKNSLSDKFKNKFADVFELPKDVVLDEPRIFMLGNFELNLENHCGIIEYGRELIRIRIYQGQLVILGEELIIKKLTKETVEINGQITNVEFKY